MIIRSKQLLCGQIEKYKYKRKKKEKKRLKKRVINWNGNDIARAIIVVVTYGWLESKVRIFNNG